ncbi:von Willebrand factor type A domain-containing protein [Cercophora scortea]|uniref:von Willebrand factor type A domain-containing protein n=1 Tax=Cercophora scortea TaxID=314031 RepID=A0AAE0MMA7_9PEZI|nr:von Willebrand factor type A domain-containing protein [Cercophora scortea]
MAIPKMHGSRLYPHSHHVCGFYFLTSETLGIPQSYHSNRKYLPQVSVSVHAQIIGATSRTVLTQHFVNPSRDAAIPELRYSFPLYDGVSVVGFVCTINNDRTIRGVVKQREEARKTYDAAIARGETAGLVEQLPSASDVYTTTVGNVPAGAEIRVEITYLGELKHDAEVDGIRFTIPTNIAPRYGDYPGELLKTSATTSTGIEIVVDAEMPKGCNIKTVQSPSHPISVSVGNTSTAAARGAEMSLEKASATLSLGKAELDADFILHVVASNSGNPVAVLETHSTIPNQRALMATLVPKFNLPPSRPEIVFVCDRSGSMGSDNKIPNLKTALHVFLKSIPLGSKFNICSFGSHHEFLFQASQSYDASSLAAATRYVNNFDANFGGTEMHDPLQQTFKQRYKDMELEVFLLTDGETWNHDQLFTMINKHVADSQGAIRVFTLGIGRDASHALIEGIARAGNGFAQAVGDNEKMNSKVVRMLKASLTPHVKDYSLEVKYGKESASGSSPFDDDFEIVEKVLDELSINVSEPESNNSATEVAAPKTISLFDPSADPDVEMTDATLDTSSGGKYSHVPSIATPKLLQAPFAIPPLYPFNRTTVYLLLSPGSTQKTPKSVILRGTSTRGPLELEIPVTVLCEKGETIHQLATRKAVKELEEGRGWIYHAKDASEAGGKLLKDKYEGRFADMVEREAVRLGVTFQVAGKWCSFVAVEDNGKKPTPQVENQHAANVRNERNIPPPRQMVDTGRVRAAPRKALASHAARKSAPTTDFGGSAGFLADSLSASLQARHQASDESEDDVGWISPDESETAERQRQLAPAPLPVSEAFSMEQSLDFAIPQVESSVLSDFDFDSFVQDESQESTKRKRSTPPMSSAPPGSAISSRSAQKSSFSPSNIFGSIMSASKAVVSSRSSGQGAVPPPPPPPAPAPSAKKGVMTRRLRKSDRDQDCSPRSASYSPSPPPAKESKVISRRSKAKAYRDDEEEDQQIEPIDVLDALVALQAFTGAWSWSKKLLRLMSVNEPPLAAKLVQQEGVKLFQPETSVMATALVLAFLETKLAGRRDEWEMLVDKARDWLTEEVAAVGEGMSVDEYVESFKGFFC